MSFSTSASASVSTSAATSASSSAAAAAGSTGGFVPVPPARIDLAAAPRGTFDPTDERLRAAATTFERALTASTVEEEEALWTVVIQSCERAGSAEWVPDIASRALGNRGNARSRQGRLAEALDDYNKAIQFAPYAVDPVLNRGVALESLGRFQEAAADYSAVLAVAPNDPAAWNNLGNTQAGMGAWSDAVESYRRASMLAPAFSFAAANYALALYEVGNDNAAIKQMRNLLRKYPEFPDMRAALAVALYAAGLRAESENAWSRVDDGRYRDREWVSEYRRWPPRLVAELAAFLDLKPV
ncbi:hypothetical protein CLOM_g4104 [Closterium sp. NIES-68]|nr:hypothetical protein CLOM_g4104 [Closterium sp. NIES-68]GJP62934.1 hypothetical protein CLOP_g19997 [Closterium sp. NIES-67]